MNEPFLDAIDRQIINQFQGGFPICDQPFAEAAQTLGITEDILIARLEALTANGALSRFGPMYNAEKLGGAVTLCALSAPVEKFDEVTECVNRHREVAHNYARDHELNMWFVIAVDTPHDVQIVIDAIEQETGLQVYNFPKQEEFFIGLRVDA